ncbi:hypothetical protein V5799_026899 [Amblyomma americanum]|uniref:Uncharacterized protein n=1 Tax=Amblyomma americanum TaxID=6943 RepID=A0AAQ4DH94_AMBAM
MVAHPCGCEDGAPGRPFEQSCCHMVTVVWTLTRVGTKVVQQGDLLSKAAPAMVTLIGMVIRFSEKVLL